MKELIYSYDLTVATLYAKGAQPQVIKFRNFYFPLSPSAKPA